MVLTRADTTRNPSHFRSMNTQHPFASIPVSLDTSKLEQMIYPKYKALDEFIDECSTDPATKTTTVTAVVLSLWQSIVRGVGERSPMPSFILSSTKEDIADPVYEFIGQLLPTSNPATGEPEQRSISSCNEIPIPREMAPRAMVQARAQHLTEFNLMPGDNENKFVQRYHQARVAGFGDGDISRYSKVWHPQLGLVSDSRDAVILRLDKKSDRQAFRNDLVGPPKERRSREGIGNDLQIIKKNTAVSGALPTKELSPKCVDAILQLGQPYFILQHTASEPIEIPNFTALEEFARQSKRAPVIIHSQQYVTDDEWYQSYERYLWKRLERLPMPCRFPVLNAVRQLWYVCVCIAHASKEQYQARAKEMQRLTFELHAHTLRGLTLSIAGLAWYGLGFDPGCSLDQIRKLLKTIRERGTMPLREVLRATWVKSAKERDRLLAILSDEGLVNIEGKNVTAVTHEDFVKGLHADPRFPQVLTFETKSKSEANTE